MEQHLKTPVAMSAALLVVVALGGLHSWPTEGLDGLRVTAQPSLRPVQACGTACAEPAGGACTQRSTLSDLSVQTHTRDCIAGYTR